MCCGLAYISLKSYPQDGSSFISRARWAFSYGGSLLALVVGRFIECKYINFHATGLTLKGIALGVIGLAVYYIVDSVYLQDLVTVLVPYITSAGAFFATGFAITFYAVVLWPLVIKKFCE